MDYFIAIPSYKRAKLCNEQTLSTLHKMGIQRERINIFIVEEEYNNYLEILNVNYYNKLIIGKLGLVQQREFIENYYDKGINVVSMDDDIKSIDLSLTDFTDLHSFFNKSFEDLKINNAFIWGVYPVYNPFFRKTKTYLSTELKYIIGAFYGFINRKNLINLNLTDGNKEDVERTIKYFLYDGIVLRYNKIGFQTKYYGTDGGGLGKLQDRLINMKITSEYLANKYPSLCKLKIRKNGLHEIVLNKKNSIKKDENNVMLLSPVRHDEFNVLYDLLENINIPYKNGRNSRHNFPKHRATIFGYVRARFSGKYGLSGLSLKHPDVYNEILRIGNLICPFNFTSIHLNKNVTCPKHKDSGNKGNSLIVSFGDYQGCNLIINEKKYDANCQPILFNGSELEHYNTELISGTKYSLVFFI